MFVFDFLFFFFFFFFCVRTDSGSPKLLDKLLCCGEISVGTETVPDPKDRTKTITKPKYIFGGDGYKTKPNGREQQWRVIQRFKQQNHRFIWYGTAIIRVLNLAAIFTVFILHIVNVFDFCFFLDSMIGLCIAWTGLPGMTGQNVDWSDALLPFAFICTFFRWCYIKCACNCCCNSTLREFDNYDHCCRSMERCFCRGFWVAALNILIVLGTVCFFAARDKIEDAYCLER